jgi:hypothetical protein
VYKKLDYVARFIETFTVRRALNYKKFGQTSIKYTMFNLIKKVRSVSKQDLGKILVDEINGIEQDWEGVWKFGMHSQNKRFVKHLLSRISSFLDNQTGMDSTYATYHHPEGKAFEIEHIWANKFEEHRDEFEQETEFNYWRNSIGALVLLPNGTNQSFNSDKYEDKLEHYLKQNTYVQTLHKTFYEKNPNFLKSAVIQKLEFRPHAEFRKEDISERLDLVKRICEDIWSTDYFENEE